MYRCTIHTHKFCQKGENFAQKKREFNVFDQQDNPSHPSLAQGVVLHSVCCEIVRTLKRGSGDHSTTLEVNKSATIVNQNTVWALYIL